MLKIRKTEKGLARWEGGREWGRGDGGDGRGVISSRKHCVQILGVKAPAGWEELVPRPFSVLCSVETGLRKRRTACAPQNTTGESMFNQFAGIL